MAVNTSSMRSDLAHLIDQIPLLDTHEHFIPEEFRGQLHLDFTYFFPHYLNSDLVSSGMPLPELEVIRTPGRQVMDYLKSSINAGAKTYPFDDLLDPKPLTIKEKWKRLRPYWSNIQNTAFAKCIQIAVADLFGISEIDEGTYEHLSEKLDQSKEPGWYDYVLKDRAKIEKCIVDIGTTQFTKPYFYPALRFDRFIYIPDRISLQRIEQECHLSIYSLKDLMLSLKTSIESAKNQGMLAIKSALAYQRTLNFEICSYAEAEKCFAKLLSHPRANLSWQESKQLQDFMMHQVIRSVIDEKIPLQVHTGFQSGNGNHIRNSDPTLLTNLFLTYPEARFDILHAGYPFSGEAAVLAKNFPNVYVNLCWMPIISPWRAENILNEWLEMIPINKIFAFGGDFTIVEGAYASAKMTKAVVANVLMEKIERRYFNEEQALRFAGMLFNENAKKFYNL